MAKETSAQPEADESANVAVQDPPEKSSGDAEIESAVSDSVGLRERLTGFVKSRWKILAGVVPVLLLLGGYLFSLTGEPEKTPKETLTEALLILESAT
ncbi:MAG: hypothetical protein KDA74_10725, partial [Planctomycetaceae bacterium]|nr:hypothetical protein [Planctomycetaceae bacterium]